MSETEIRECLRALLGEGMQGKIGGGELKELNAREFAEQVLGFEPLTAPASQQPSQEG